MRKTLYISMVFAAMLGFFSCGGEVPQTPDGFNEFMNRHHGDIYILNHMVKFPQVPDSLILNSAWIDVKTHWLSGPQFNDYDLWGTVNYWPTPDESATKAIEYPGYWGVGNCKAFAIFMYFYLSEHYGIESKLGLKIDPDIGGHMVVIVAGWSIDETGVQKFRPDDEWHYIMKTTWFSEGWLVPEYRPSL